MVCFTMRTRGVSLKFRALREKEKIERINSLLPIKEEPEEEGVPGRLTGHLPIASFFDHFASGTLAPIYLGSWHTCALLSFPPFYLMKFVSGTLLLREGLRKSGNF